MPSTPLRNVRVPDDVWLPAKARAREERTSVTAVVPPGVAGTVAVTVVSPAGTSPVTGSDHFTYR